MDKTPKKILLVWGEDGSINIIHKQDDISPRNTSSAYIRYDLHESEIARLTAELREARMQALADGAQWQDDVARLTAEREAAVAAALEAVGEYVRSQATYTVEAINKATAAAIMENLGQVVQSETCRTLSREIEALATDTQRNALAEYGRRMRAEGLREAAKIQANAGLSNEREWNVQKSILARADEIERGETA